MAGMTYNPASFDFTERVVFVDGLIRETLTPGTTDPLGSVTTPEISPAVDWAKSLDANNRKARANSREARIQNPPKRRSSEGYAQVA
jgi:hypothetical protein